MRVLGVKNKEIGIRIFSVWNLRRFDPILALFVVVLSVYGLFVLYSAGRSAPSSTPYYVKQSMFFLMGWAIALVISCLDYRFVISVAPAVYTVFLGLLAAVLVVGDEIKGSRRWLDLGPIGFQPSESAKLVMVFTLAWYLTLIGRRVEKLPYFLLTFVLVAVPGLMIFKEPDLGTAVVLGPIAVAMLFAAGCRVWHMAGVATLGLVALPVAWSHMKDYQKQRVMTLIDPSADPQGSGYHTIQSMITVGSGGLTGKGYLHGTQTYLSYLPEHHTDFIFSQLAEEFGFVGGCAALALFLGLFWRALHIARSAADPGGSLLAVGCVTLLAFHVFVNTSITIGILPVTGIPLPFFSYGGTFCLTTMSCIGVILSVNARRSVPGQSSRPLVLSPARQGVV
jgi:rod shape determining protein RodA